jgi:hypothetical protein
VVVKVKHNRQHPNKKLKKEEEKNYQTSLRNLGKPKKNVQEHFNNLL